MSWWRLKGNKASKADVALGKIRKLYAIEEEIKELTTPKKKGRRQEDSKPLLDDQQVATEKNVIRLILDSLTHKAMSYALNHWSKLVVYCADGHLNISNTAAENAIHLFTVGRRNRLFGYAPKGAEASATYYSLIESAKTNGLEPFKCLSKF